MSRAVGVICDGETLWHAPGVTCDYDTLCGLDSNDPAMGVTPGPAPKPGQKIDCPTCKSIWKDVLALRLRKSEFK
jgi:hypothetical protein